MITYKNLTLIGTSHISIESIKEVRKIILEEKPEVVALELDRGRFRVLMNKENGNIRFSGILKIGFKGYIFAKIGNYIEKKLGNIVGVKPGDEMREAILCAKKINSKIALIDQEIELTLKKFSEKITWKEKLSFIEDIIINIVKRPKIKFDLKKVPDKRMINNLLSYAKKRYPNVYYVLVDERNKIMAKHLYKIMQEYKVVGVVGAGHEEEIIKVIKCLEKKR